MLAIDNELGDIAQSGRWEISLTVHPDFASDNAALLYLAHRTARDYVARAPDIVAIQPARVKCGMTNDRGSISRHANRFQRGENFAQLCPGCPWIEVHVRRWSRSGYREAWGSCGRIDYITSSYRNAAPPFLIKVEAFPHTRCSARWSFNFFACGITFHIDIRSETHKISSEDEIHKK